MQEKGCLVQRLRAEADLVSSITVDETMEPLKQVVQDMLQVQLTWEIEIAISFTSSLSLT